MRDFARILSIFTATLGVLPGLVLFGYFVGCFFLARKNGWTIDTGGAGVGVIFFGILFPPALLLGGSILWLTLNGPVPVANTHHIGIGSILIGISIAVLVKDRGQMAAWLLLGCGVLYVGGGALSILST